ncbi:MAG: hypoxanthine phosphoribosyltransferase [bacterium]
MDIPSREAVRELISEAAISRRVAELAWQISADCEGRELLLIGVLKGSWVFVADLARRLTVPVEIDFITVSSYRKGTRTSGVVEVVTDLRCPLADRDVLLVEDILDSGLTMSRLLDILRRRGPRSLRVCVLMDKRARRKVEVKADYIGFEVPDRFVVGYGADFAERFRNLPFIGFVEEGEMGGQDGARGR